MAEQVQFEQVEVHANGLRFATLQAGEGKLALLLHGFPDTPHGFSAIAGPLVAAGYRVVAPFMRGYYPTEVPSQDATVQDLAADALALIAALGHSSALLIGHDWGAATAYLAARLAPESVDQLVAVGIPHPSALRPSLRLAWVSRHFFTLRLPGGKALLKAGGVERLCRRWSPTWVFGPEEMAPVRACFAHPESLNAAVGYYRAFNAKASAASLRGQISVPTLAVAGRDDPALHPDVYESARRKFSGCYQVVALPGGHFVHRESPEAFETAVLDFLSANS